MKNNRLWAIHVTALTALIVWIALDPLFATMIQVRSFVDASANAGWLRVAGLALVGLVAIASLIALFATTLGRRRSGSDHRSIRQLLLITTVIGLWCSLAHHHDAVAWQGKRARFVFRVDELEGIAAPLRDDWPERDGERTKIGPFMAYPFGRPTTLLLLQSPRIARQSVYVSAIERCTDGAIKLQLSGTDGGDWAEWHPPHSRPDSFIGGLADPHELRTATAIGSGWYLVRYQT